ncbi:hypothetical protein CYY_006116 [Polysphondylium violaceum]|uniref:ABC transporter domain-containing protein n=1 Tax=Polysphondylium violaceum TaxID=133409 RepID=A0A8J4PS86_9MYCE|nr:hypothetical protein CYY_006116 [Polysphondylium violaceum]
MDDEQPIPLSPSSGMSSPDLGDEDDELVCGPNAIPLGSIRNRGNSRDEQQHQQQTYYDGDRDHSSMNRIEVPQEVLDACKDLNNAVNEIAISLEENRNLHPITITLDDVCVRLRDTSSVVGKALQKSGLIEPAKQGKKKVLLNNINAAIKPGQVCAILGGSGSGKTTLLNTISGRYSRAEIKVTGGIKFNNLKPSPQLIRRAVGYVMQKDFLLPNLTVRESLQYSALLRLPDSVSKAEKMLRVENIIKELNLKDCADTRVGGVGQRGISGGEKRRLSVGCQLLTDPAVMFLDEPTSGLDSFTSFQVIQTLSFIARQNRTVICTIHQPRSDIFKLFDQVMLLSKGQLVYLGPATEMVNHFSRLNFVCPKLENPADYFIDICSIDYRNQALENASFDRLGVLVQGYHASKTYTDLKEQLSTANLSISASQDANDDDQLAIQLSSTELRSSKPFYISIPIITGRSYKNALRDVATSITRVSQVVSFGIMMALCFLRISYDQYGVQNRTGFLYESLSMIFIALLNCVALFPTERNLFYRERNDGLYSTLSFFISYLFVEVPFNIFGSLGYACVTYFALGLKHEAGSFFVFTLVIFTLLFAGESVGLLVCSLFYDVGIATTIANVLLSLFTILAGFFRPTASLPHVLRYFNYILPTKWAAEIISVNELRGATFTCPGSQSLDGNGTICPISTGEQVLETYSWQDVNMTHSILIMVSLAIAYRIVVYLVLKFNRKNVVL